MADATDRFFRILLVSCLRRDQFQLLFLGSRMDCENLKVTQGEVPVAGTAWALAFHGRVSQSLDPDEANFLGVWL